MNQDNTLRWRIFLSSVFFVLGFSVVFSLLGVLLQTILANISLSVQVWLARVGGIVIIFFGLFLSGLITPAFLLKERKFEFKRHKSIFLTSFIFGAAFAVGWTPCVSAALGAILTLASTQASSAFLLLVAYTLGLGIPFLILGFFADSAKNFIVSSRRFLTYFQYFFGVVLIILGILVFTSQILVFTSQLSKVANLSVVSSFLASLNIGTTAGSDIASLTFFNLVISFLAGLSSFLSPCVLPLLPGFLSYLASTVVEEKNE